MGGKHLVIDYRALNKVTRNFTWPMPQSRGYILQTKRSYIFYNFGPLCRIPSHSPGTSHLYPRLPLIHPSENRVYKSTIQTCTSTSILPGVNDRYTQGFSLCHQPIWMTLSYLAKHHRNTFHPSVWYLRNLK